MPNYTNITAAKEINKLVKLCQDHNYIDPELYDRYHVKQGLREPSGKGVLTGLTEISTVSGSKEVDGKIVPIEGKLSYRGIDINDLDLVFLENVGNLVCPAEFDTGASMDIMILSIPEGDDKPLKYPLVFEKCDLVIINKIDALPYFDFDLEKCKKAIKMRNPNATIIPISAKTGENIDQVAIYFKEKIQNWKEK